jgi:transposase
MLKFIFIYPRWICENPSTHCAFFLIADALKINPACGHLFLFRSRSGNKIKALHYEPNCFTLWYRRLEKGRFIFPKNREGQIEMTREHFQWLLSSDKFSRLEVLDAQYENYV